MIYDATKCAKEPRLARARNAEVAALRWIRQHRNADGSDPSGLQAADEEAASGGEGNEMLEGEEGEEVEGEEMEDDG